MSTGTATGGTQVSPSTPAPKPAPTRQGILHNFLTTLQADVVAFPAFIAAIKNNSPLPGAFAKLESVRDDLVSAYNSFLLVEQTLAALAALETAGQKTP